MTRIRFVAALSLLFTALFFIEYTPVLPRMRIPYDLEGFHYPLADYAFRALKQGRFPQWDPTTYCGLSFADNAQTAIYYPPMWLMFALKWGSAKNSPTGPWNTWRWRTSGSRSCCAMRGFTGAGSCTGWRRFWARAALPSAGT